MTKLHRRHDEQGQSPWLDNLTREHLRSGELEDQGVAAFTRSFAGVMARLQARAPIDA